MERPDLEELKVRMSVEAGIFNINPQAQQSSYESTLKFTRSGFSFRSVPNCTHSYISVPFTCLIFSIKICELLTEKSMKMLKYALIHIGSFMSKPSTNLQGDRSSSFCVILPNNKQSNVDGTRSGEVIPDGLIPRLLRDSFSITIQYDLCHVTCRLWTKI